MTKLMDPNRRREIDEAIEKAASLAAEGLHPDEAIVKVAKENDYNANVGRLMARNFNVTKTLAHFDSFKGNSEKRAESFAVADAEKVASQLEEWAEQKHKKVASIPAQVTGTIPDMLDLSTTVSEFEEKYLSQTKVASDEPIDIFMMERLLDLKEKVKEKVAEAKSLAGQHKVAYEKQFAFLGDVFRYGGVTRAEEDARLIHGEKVAKSIFDTLWEHCPYKELGFVRSEKTASFAEDNSRLNKEVSKLVDLAVKHAEALEVFDKLAAEAGQEMPEVAFMKGLGSSAVESLDKATKFLDTQATKEKPSSDLDFTDLKLPLDLENEFKNARSSMVISDILADDPVLSNEDPGIVANAARQQLELNPELLEYPTVLAGLIRRSIAAGGDVDPFQGHQVIRMGKGGGNA